MVTFGVMAAILIIAIFSGSMVALAMGLVASVSMAFFLGVPSLVGVGPSLWGTSYSFILTCVPLFILMGCLLSESGASRRLFDALFLLLRRLPGGDPPPLNWSTRYDSSGRTDNEYQTT